MKSFSVVFSFGSYGGFWANNTLRKGGTFRLTLGWMAITILRPEFDIIMHNIIDEMEELEGSSGKENK